jgi:hypothetical protein
MVSPDGPSAFGDLRRDRLGRQGRAGAPVADFALEFRRVMGEERPAQRVSRSSGPAKATNAAGPRGQARHEAGKELPQAFCRMLCD